MSTAPAQQKAEEAAVSAPALFDPERMRNYPRIVVGIFLLSAILLVVTSHDGLDLKGRPLGYDFITFWAASELTLDGRPEAAFDMDEAHDAQQKAIPATQAAYLWHYPPTFQLLAAPLALLPYAFSFLVFSALGFGAYLYACRPLLDQPNPYWLLAAFPATLLCLYQGQNSLYSAALFAGAALASEKGGRGALWAGLFIGLLAFKPQFGLLIPFALIAAGQWRIFFAAAVATLGFCGLATAAFGFGLWQVFFDNLALVRAIFEDGLLPWSKMPSAWVFFRYLGAGAEVAYALQALVALGAAATVVIVWRRIGMTRASWAVLVSASLLVPPYLFDYEMALLAIPLAIVASDMAEHCASRGEKLWLLALVLAPPLTSYFAEVTHLQVGFPLLLAALWLVVRRSLRETA